MPELHSDFDEFARSRADGLLRLAFLLCGDRHLAEDLLQDVLERTYLRWEHIRESPDGYTRRALVNRTISHWRWRHRHREAPLSKATEPVVSDHASEVSDRRAVLGALRELSGRQRAAIVLRYLDELPINEVADILGCSEGAVKSHTARGLARLREVLPQATFSANGDLHG